MKISRRKVVVLGASAVSASLLPLNLLAQSDGQSAEDIIKEFTGGANIGSGDIMLRHLKLQKMEILYLLVWNQKKQQQSKF